MHPEVAQLWPVLRNILAPASNEAGFLFSTLLHKWAVITFFQNALNNRSFVQGETMSSDITLKEIAPSPALSIKAEVGTFKMAKVMGPAYEKIMAHYQANGIETTENDIPYCVYHDTDWDQMKKKGIVSMIKLMFFHNWKLEMGIPAKAACSPAEDMVSAAFPSGKFLSTIHKGPYMKVSETYNKLIEYAEQNGLQFDNYAVERYLNDPREVQSSEIQTEVLVPLK